MTPQQAGVSAEAVAKLAAAWREAIVKLKAGVEESPSYDLKRMIKERSEAFTICADELEALATAPPEQAIPEAKPISAWIEQQQQTTPREQAAHSQAVSAEVPSDSFALIVKDLREAKATMNGKPVMEVSVGMNWIADRIERLLEATPIIHGQAELAAHDQKVRSEKPSTHDEVQDASAGER